MDSPVPEDSSPDEVRQKEHLQKIQTYRLVRENMLKYQNQRQLNRTEMRSQKLDIYEKMQVSVDLPVSPVFKHQILNFSPVWPLLSADAHVSGVPELSWGAEKLQSDSGDRREHRRGSWGSPEGGSRPAAAEKRQNVMKLIGSNPDLLTQSQLDVV